MRLVGALLGLSLFGCGNGRDSASTTRNNGGSDPTGSSASFVDPGETFCGDESHTPIQTKPLVYFVLDASGSMQAKYGDGAKSRYIAVGQGAVDMVDSLKSVIRLGATLFPGKADQCGAGDEVYPPGEANPDVFVNAINVFPQGGTPISSTLEVVKERLADQQGPTAVVLLTDGAPNCNPDLACGASSCTIHIEGLCEQANCCSFSNCCAGFGENCVDHLAMLDAIAALKNAGILVYVVGIPGTEAYETVLDLAAVNGGTAQETGPTKYYRVSELDEINKVFKSIVAGLIECRISLETAPPVPEKTNVYFDDAVVVFDPENGWSWETEEHLGVVFSGEACSQVKGGHVEKIQVLSGCPTVVPK